MKRLVSNLGYAENFPIKIPINVAINSIKRGDIVSKTDKPTTS
jgi:hypothetical protein